MGGGGGGGRDIHQLLSYCLLTLNAIIITISIIILFITSHKFSVSVSN